ncbi:MAG TPA: NAD(P)/FAD-dependent oxidoreductase [Candidatus Baltobacteraceae bacterium]|jgi:protoporphyrinogen oxidase|nr:NAD(P)/FAD-dependent oxidoreductase [Candidatus Baltobacteraceae bacterium]
MRYGVVGGGLLGMTLAWNLSKAGHAVTIFEGSPRCGGLAAPWELGGVVWDRHYHVTLSSDLALRALLCELDLEGDLQWVKAKTGFYVDRALHSFSGAVDYLRFPALDPIQKARLALTIVRASRIRNWRPLERITAVEWLTRQCGAATVEKIWLPLLRAKLGPYAHKASAAFIWAIIARMYSARGNGPQSELFGYVRGGYNLILTRFEQRLAKRGVDIKVSSPVERIQASENTIDLVTKCGAFTFDRAIVTLAAPLAAKLCTGLTARERTLASAVEYQGIVCASVLTEHPLTPYYITNIADGAVPFTAAIEMSALVDRREFGGKTLLYLPKYVASGDPALRMTDQEVEATFLSALGKMHPQFDRRDVSAFRVSRVPYVFPIPTVGYSERLPAIRTSLPSLFAVNSAHIVNGTLNVNETVKLAHSVTPMLLTPDSSALRELVLA